MAYSTKRFIIGPDDSGRRADRVVRSLLSAMPLSAVYRLFRDGAVRSGGRRIDGSSRLEAGATLDIRLPDTVEAPETSASREAAAADPRLACERAKRFSEIILLETPDLVVVNKPRGRLTHGPDGVDEDAKAYFADRMARSLAFAPGPLHRLDRNTSGALVVSASQAGAAAFSEALRAGLVGKLYLALLGGELAGTERWIDRLSRDDLKSRVSDEGAAAEAEAIPVAARGGMTLAVIRLGTGRTHQIRAQAASRGLALAGDSKYGGKPLPGGYILHCATLDLPALPGGVGPLRVEAPLPPRAAAALRSILGPSCVEAASAALSEALARAPRTS
ncbi:MAG: RluA family pseudouridine synthase [Spirochaetaceae bacterium]|nr:RluA family pseudouridine synthase [Spirochaetaceae bacterium]